MADNCIRILGDFIQYKGEDVAKLVVPAGSVRDGFLNELRGDNVAAAIQNFVEVLEAQAGLSSDNRLGLESIRQLRDNALKE